VLGIYDTPDDTPGVSSIPLPNGWLSSGAAALTRALERLDDLVPGLGGVWELPWR